MKNNLLESYLVYIDEQAAVTAHWADMMKRFGKVAGPTGRYIANKVLKYGAIPKMEKKILAQKKLIQKLHAKKDWKGFQKAMADLKDLEKQMYIFKNVKAHAAAYKDKLGSAIKGTPQLLRRGKYLMKSEKNIEKAMDYIQTGKVKS